MLRVTWWFRALLGCAVVALGCDDSPSGDRDGGDGRDGPIASDAAIDAVADASLLLLPDLTVNVDRARADMAIRIKNFDIDACELDPVEDCIDAAGERTLLHFSVETPNIGNADMFLGSPSPTNPQFEYSTCHDHFHFLGYAEYELLDASGAPVATGQKQAFCLLDSERYVTDDPSVSGQAKYWCEYQGIQRGWADVYHSRLPCQFIDVTDTAPGAYTLKVSINNGGTLEELRYDNNVVELPVTLGDPNLSTPTEPCAADLDERSARTINRECGWTLAQTFSCTPGHKFTVGCVQTCVGGQDNGSCTGDPMMRVCDAARPDGNCSHPASIDFDDDACGSQCPMVFNEDCPPSGMVAVYHAPFSDGAPYTCDVAFRSN